MRWIAAAAGPGGHGEPRGYLVPRGIHAAVIAASKAASRIACNLRVGGA